MKFFALIACLLAYFLFFSEPNLGRAGYYDGYASGYNEQCKVRDTAVAANWENSTYKTGFSKGLSEGRNACIDGPEVCPLSEIAYLQRAIENIDLMLTPREGHIFLTWVYGYGNKVLPNTLKFSSNYAEAKAVMNDLTSNCSIIAIANSISRPNDAAELVAMGPYVTRQLRNSLSSAFVMDEADEHYLCSSDKAEVDLRQLKDSIISASSFN